MHEHVDTDYNYLISLYLCLIPDECISPLQHQFILKTRYVFRDWVNKSITEHVEKFDSANILDFIDAHLAQKEENEAAGMTDSYITGYYSNTSSSSAQLSSVYI